MKLKTLKKEEQNVETQDEEVDVKKLLKMKGKKKNRLYGKRVDSKTQKGRYIKVNFQKLFWDRATLRAACLSSKGKIKLKVKTYVIKSVNTVPGHLLLC